MSFKYPVVFGLILFATLSLAQRPAGKTDPAMYKNMPAIGRVYGKILEAGSKQPVEFATVTLLAMQKDSAISGGLAKANGDFNLTKLPMGRYRLKISFIGYKALVRNIVITPNLLEQDLGDIALEVDGKNLAEAVVQGEKATVIMTVDRRIYNVDKDISARGGTGIDVIKNIPGLTVDADGGVTLRNSSPTIFVDGRPTTLTLEQIPADEIERVEVITNPSAKFDASTSGGILNIVLKKNTKPGYNGLITLGYGIPNRYNGMANINIKEGRSNFGLSYNVNRSLNPTKGFTNRTSLLNGKETGYFDQDNTTDAIRLMQNARLSFDYNITNRTMITLAQGFTGGGFETDEVQRFEQRSAERQVITSGNRNMNQDTKWKNYSSQLLLRKTYPQRGKEFTTDLTYNKSERRNDADFYTYNYDSANKLMNPGEQLQYNRGDGSSDNLTFQFDFVNPVSDTTKWEFGVRSNYRVEKTKLEVTNRDNISNSFITDTALTNNYRIDELINAAYVTYTSMLMGIGYQAGLRVEQTRFIGELIGKNQTFEYIYPDGSKNLAKAMFPSLYLTKRVGEKHEIQLNFSRKIGRPGFMQVMPFVMFADKLNYRIGNPNLAPEFNNNLELNYNRILPGGNLFAAAYLKITEDPITNFTQQLSSDTTGTVLINTFINGNTMYNYGGESNYKFSLFKRKLDVTLNANVFYTDISANNGTTELKNSGMSWNGKVIVSYKLPKQFTVQANGNYEAPRIIPQGKTLDVYSIDISLNKEVNKLLSFNLVLNDVFNTRRFGTNFQSAFVEQDISRRRETRFLRLSVTWRFGEMDASLFKRRTQRRGEGGGMDVEF